MATNNQLKVIWNSRDPMIYGSAGPCVIESFVGFLARPMKAGRSLLRYLDVAVRGRRRLAPGVSRLIVFSNSYSRDMTGGDACCIEIMTRLEDFDNSHSDFRVWARKRAAGAGWTEHSGLRRANGSLRT